MLPLLNKRTKRSMYLLYLCLKFPKHLKEFRWVFFYFLLVFCLALRDGNHAINIFLYVRCYGIFFIAFKFYIVMKNTPLRQSVFISDAYAPQICIMALKIPNFLYFEAFQLFNNEHPKNKISFVKNYQIIVTEFLCY